MKEKEDYDSLSYKWFEENSMSVSPYAWLCALYGTRND